MSEEELRSEDKKIINIMKALEEQGFEVVGYISYDLTAPTIEEQFESLWTQARSFLPSDDSIRFLKLFNQYLEHATNARQS